MTESEELSARINILRQSATGLRKLAEARDIEAEELCKRLAQLEMPKVTQYPGIASSPSTTSRTITQ